MIDGCQEFPVTARTVLVLDLRMRSFKVMLVHESFIVMRRSTVDSAWPAVESHPSPLVDYHGAVINMNVRDPDVIDTAVVIEIPAVPIAAFIAFTEITETVIDAAVEANVWAPVARVPKICAAVPTPVTRGPEQARLRRDHPSAGHPVVAIRSVSPVAGSPNVPIARARWLGVNRQYRGRNVYGHKNSRKR
jgi:hypothetical protein